jgi:hypothetical protein
VEGCIIWRDNFGVSRARGLILLNLNRERNSREGREYGGVVMRDMKM